VTEPAPANGGSSLLELLATRFRMFFREPSAVFWTFGFPIILSLALGIAFRNRPPEPVRAAVVEGEGAPALLAALNASPNVKAKIENRDEAERDLVAGKVAIVVIGGPQRIYRFDSTRPESRLARAIVDDVLQRADGRADPTKVQDVLVSEPGARYIDFLIPGLIGMNVLSGGMWGVGYVIVEFRTRKLIKRMLATPMKRTHFLISFVLMRTLFLIVELPVMLTFAHFVFGVGMRGSLALYSALTVLGAFAFSGLGLLVAARSENTSTANGLMNLVMLPMFMCSGVFFSTANFPDAMQPVIKFLPLTCLNEALRAIANEGAGLATVGSSALILAAWAVVTFAVSLKIFRWR
jgi:ABC-type multidrug transport system permease subunit